MDIFARYRPLRMTHKGGDGDLGEAQVITDAGEAVAQNMRSDAFEGRAQEYLVPMVWKAVSSPRGPGNTYVPLSSP